MARVVHFEVHADDPERAVRDAAGIPKVPADPTIRWASRAASLRASSSSEPSIATVFQ